RGSGWGHLHVGPARPGSDLDLEPIPSLEKLDVGESDLGIHLAGAGAEVVLVVHGALITELLELLHDTLKGVRRRQLALRGGRLRDVWAAGSNPEGSGEEEGDGSVQGGLGW